MKKIILLIVIVLVGGAGYFAFAKKSKPIVKQAPPTQTAPSLSEDHKSIVADGKILLAIDDATIVDFFRKSFLCTPENIGSTPDRKMFCEDTATFKKLTRFVSIVVSPNRQTIGFTLESDTLTPDTAAGIFYASHATNRVHMFPGYYIGETLISFSPNGEHFIYQDSCFEGMCGLRVENTETLADELEINNPGLGADGRSEDAKFIRWVSDNEVEYKLGTELKRESFDIPPWAIHHNAEYGFILTYPDQQITISEIPKTKDHDLFEIYFLWPQTGNPIGGMRIFSPIPSSAFNSKSLADYIQSGGKGWEQSFSPFTGYDSAYAWQCRDGENKGGDTIRSCYFQHGDTVYIFDYTEPFHFVLSRKNFDRMVKGFNFDYGKW